MGEADLQRNCLARLPPVFPRKSAVSSCARGRCWAYEAVNPRFSPEKQGLDALHNYPTARLYCSLSIVDTEWKAMRQTFFAGIFIVGVVFHAVFLASTGVMASDDSENTLRHSGEVMNI